jgi:hypothetical protein
MDAAAAAATEADIHSFAQAMPHTTVWTAPSGRSVYQVGGKSFVYFRTPRKDAADPVTGERYDDVVIFWVEGEDAKQALVQDPSTPFFTTDHFSGHPSVLLRLARVGELSRLELAEVIEDAWLAQASERRGRLYLGGTGRITS